MTTSRRESLGTKAAWVCVAAFAVEALGAPMLLTGFLAAASAGLGTVAVLRL